MTGSFRSGAPRRDDGLVLIEVMMAVMLLAVLVVPLVSGVQSTLRAADAVKSRSAGLSAHDPAADEAWEWGEEVSAARWRPGPTLDIRSECGGSVERAVGLWVDGWFLGEWAVSDGGQVEVGPRAWSDLTGDELVVRVRREGSTWGPPWRLVVPSVDGQPLAGELSSGGVTSRVVAHVPALGNPHLGLSWTDVMPEAAVEGLVFVCSFPSSGRGEREIELDGREQSLTSGASRDLDIYF